MYALCLGALHFALKPEDYDEGIHTLVVMATSVQGEKDNETLIFGNDRHFNAIVVWQTPNVSMEKLKLGYIYPENVLL